MCRKQETKLYFGHVTARQRNAGTSNGVGPNRRLTNLNQPITGRRLLSYFAMLTGWCIHCSGFSGNKPSSHEFSPPSIYLFTQGDSLAARVPISREAKSPVCLAGVQAPSKSVKQGVRCCTSSNDAAEKCPSQSTHRNK